MPTWYNDLAYNQANVSALNNVSGVYAIKDANLAIIYIGKGDPISDRLISHAGNTETNGLLRNYLSNQVCLFCYTVISTEADRESWERYYIQTYQPVCNLQNNPSSIR
jgi:excinuclease UvrABC nuclease subunit